MLNRIKNTNLYEMNFDKCYGQFIVGGRIMVNVKLFIPARYSTILDEIEYQYVIEAAVEVDCL